MPAGHTKFAPDWCFGLLKRRFKLCEMHCLADLCRIVETSTNRGINQAQLIGTEDGQVQVEVFDWQSFFGNWFRPLKGIKSIHHFHFSAANEGTVLYKKTLDGPEESFSLVYGLQAAKPWLRNRMPKTEASGIPEARQEYLRQQIRLFVRVEAQDI